MELLDTLTTSFVAALAVAVVHFLNRGQFAEVKARLSRVESQLDDLRSEFRGDVASLRSDLTQVALAVGARRAPNAG